MSTDKHFNEHGGIPETLEDHQPTDMTATKSIFLILAVIVGIGMAVLATLQLVG
jgi:hypothetical protein